MSMRRIACLVVALCLAVLPAAAQVIDMEVYLIDPCGGCGGRVGIGCKTCTIQDEIATRYKQLFAKDEVNIHFYNLRMDNTLEADMRARLDALGVDAQSVALPIVFVDDKLFAADGSMDQPLQNYIETGEYPGIEQMLRERAQYEASRVPGRVVYLYSSYCEDCQAISDWLVYSLPTGYELVKYDIYTDEGLAMEEYFLENLDISEEEYCIPLIVYGDYWFAGKESIYLSLKSRIQEHPDERTVILEEVLQED